MLENGTLTKKVLALTQMKEDSKKCQILIHHQETCNANPMEESHLWFVFVFLYQLGSHANTFLRKCTMEGRMEQTRFFLFSIFYFHIVEGDNYKAA